MIHPDTKKLRQCRKSLDSIGRELNAIDRQFPLNEAVRAELKEIAVVIELTLAATDPKAK